MAEIFQADLYGSDGTTIVASFSTDPGHARPYIVAVSNLASQEITFAEGRATIGGCNIEIVDVPTNPADQDTGYFTSLLADANGVAAAIGRRMNVRAWIGGAWENVLNAVIADITLHESYSSYTLTLKDQRENERRISAFTRATTASILPAGVIDGFGLNAFTGEWLIPPTEPIEALYTEYVQAGLTYGNLGFPGRDNLVPLWQVLTDRALAALTSFENLNLDGTYDPARFRYDKVALHWRSAPGAYNVVENPGYAGGHFLGGKYKDANVKEESVTYLKNWTFIWPAGATRPTNNTTIEVIFGYAGPTSEDYPYHLEGVTYGEVLKDLYDGDFSEPGSFPPVQYDSTAVLALTDPFRARITEPIDSDDGIWAWTEENIYAPTGSAPALDSQGRISPIKYALPPTGASLLQLDDSNCEPSPGWAHGDADVINSVSVEYVRLLAVPADKDPLGRKAAGDGLVSRDIEVQLGEELPELAASIAIFGQRWLKLRSVGLTAIGGADGEPVTGDVMDETGTQLAAKRAREAVDRFLYGGQRFTVRAARSALGATRVGDWCIVACSWMPSYESQERGANNLAQVMRVTPLDSTWSEVELIDAGPNNTPIGAPTIGAITVTAEGVVSVPVSAVPAGGDARADYAISTLEPAGTSPLWLYAGRVSAAGTIMTPALPAGAVAWIRTRGEKEGRRPSAWTTKGSIAIPQTARVTNVRVVVNQTDGSVVVTWTPNAYALGVRLHYDAHDAAIDPTFATVDKDASLGTHTFAAGTVALGQMFTVDVEGYTGWTGSAVSGTAGPKVRGFDLLTDTGVNEAAPVLQIHAVLSTNKDTADVSIKVSSASAEGTRIHYHDDETTSSPTIWSLVTGTGSTTPLFAANNSVVDASNWFYNGSAWAQKLNDIALTRDQIERIFLQGEGQSSALKSLWVPFAIDVKGQPWLESVVAMWDDTNDWLRGDAKLGGHCASVKLEWDQDPAFGSVNDTSNQNGSDGASLSDTYSPGSGERGKMWYLRVTPYNLTGQTGLAGVPQVSSIFVTGNVTKLIKVAGHAFQPNELAETEFRKSGVYGIMSLVKNKTLHFFAPVIFPAGKSVEITGVRAFLGVGGLFESGLSNIEIRLLRIADSGSAVEVTYESYPDTDYGGIESITPTDSCSEFTAGEAYSLQVSIFIHTSSAGFGNVRYCEIDYVMPDYEAT